MNILFKYPTRSRPDKFFDTLDKYYAKISVNKHFSFLITIDEDDSSMNNKKVLDRLKKYKNLKCHIANCKNKIEAVNEGVFECVFDIVVVVSDDMIPQVDGYDEIIRNDMKRHFPNTDGCLWYNDGFQKDKVNTLQIMGSKWYRRYGYIYHPSYYSLFSDLEYQEVAKSKNKIVYINNIIIKHEHPNYGYGLYDMQYLKNNVDEKHDESVYNSRKALGFPVGIPKIAHFVWSEGTPLNYMRYLTYRSFKYLNPDWKIMFHLVKGCENNFKFADGEKLEFQTKDNLRDYLANVGEFTYHEVDGIAPNYASDLIRWKVLYEHGGYYFDLDQLFCKSFNDLLNYDIVWGGDKINYSGVLGMFTHCPIAKLMHESVKNVLEGGAERYCEAGNWLWSSFISSKQGKTLLSHYKPYQTPMAYFYPVERSEHMKEYYNGRKPDLRNAYALHWFGGHPDSQEFISKSESEINKILMIWQS